MKRICLIVLFLMSAGAVVCRGAGDGAGGDVTPEMVDRLREQLRQLREENWDLRGKIGALKRGLDTGKAEANEALPPDSSPATTQPAGVSHSPLGEGVMLVDLLKRLPPQLVTEQADPSIAGDKAQARQIDDWLKSAVVGKTVRFNMAPVGMHSKLLGAQAEKQIRPRVKQPLAMQADALSGRITLPCGKTLLVVNVGAELNEPVLWSSVARGELEAFHGVVTGARSAGATIEGGGGWTLQLTLERCVTGPIHGQEAKQPAANASAPDLQHLLDQIPPTMVCGEMESNRSCRDKGALFLNWSKQHLFGKSYTFQMTLEGFVDMRLGRNGFKGPGDSPAMRCETIQGLQLAGQPCGVEVNALLPRGVKELTFNRGEKFWITGKLISENSFYLTAGTDAGFGSGYDGLKPWTGVTLTFDDCTFKPVEAKP